jgi:hypothetical protein
VLALLVLEAESASGFGIHRAEGEKRDGAKVTGHRSAAGRDSRLLASRSEEGGGQNSKNRERERERGRRAEGGKGFSSYDKDKEGEQKYEGAADEK